MAKLWNSLSIECFSFPYDVLTLSLELTVLTVTDFNLLTAGSF